MPQVVSAYPFSWKQLPGRRGVVSVNYSYFTVTCFNQMLSSWHSAAESAECYTYRKYEDMFVCLIVGNGLFVVFCMKVNIYLFFFNFFKLLFCCSITVVYIFSPPLPPTPAKPTSLPCFHPPPWFCPCVLYSSSWKPFSSLSPPSPGYW